MFGYISVNKPEMKVKDFEIYKAVYCGLCRYLGKNYGFLSKLCLSYDMTFVSLLQAALLDGCDGYEQKCCRANPFKKCTYCKNDDEYHSLSAAATVVLFDLKLADNIDDTSFIKGLPYRMLRLFTKYKSKKAYTCFPKLKEIIDDYFAEQKEVEKNQNCSIDLAAEPSAKAVSQILGLIKCDEKYKFVLLRMGYCLGKWIYLCDAADDLEKDIKKHNFNPLKAELPSDIVPLTYVEERLTPILNTCFAECANYFELLEIKKYKDILDNIIYQGLSVRQKKIFRKEKTNEKPL